MRCLMFLFCSLFVCVIQVTGDHSLTARRIALDSGILTAEQAVNDNELLIDAALPVFSSSQQQQQQASSQNNENNDKQDKKLLENGHKPNVVSITVQPNSH